MLFDDRVDAGRRLATRLTQLRDEKPVVLGLPRGGVPVAFAVAQRLGAPLDVIVVRKLGVPYQPELAMGAVGEGGIRIVNDDVLRFADVGEAEVAAVERREGAEVAARARRFRGDRHRISLAGRTVILVDDGIATGSTMRAAIKVARAEGAKRVVVAVPVAPAETVRLFRREADEFICLHSPEMFFSVGQWYRDFTQTSDAEVARLLRPAGRDEEVTLAAGHLRLPGQLTVPEAVRGIVLFAHGSGSSRLSPRNRYVAQVLNQAGVGTLLFDLLTPDEEGDRAHVFDIDLLARRLRSATDWLTAQPEYSEMHVGYFGASTGAAAALVAAADPKAEVEAVVSRGGRPDLAGDRLTSVRAPTLLIVGGYDDVVLDLNRQAQRLLHCPNRLAVVPGATHLFEEPGTLQAAAELARDWFLLHLAAPKPAPAVG